MSENLVDKKTAWWRLPGVVPVFFMFFLEAFVLGNWIPRIPDVKAAFEFSASQLGLSMFVLASGTLVAFLAGGKLLKRLGLRYACAVSLPLWTLAVFAVPFMPDGFALAVLLFAGGMAIGLVEIGMNTAADRLERVTGRRLMSKAHGFWSIGSLVGALLGGALGGAGVSLVTHFSLVLPLFAIIGLIMALRIPRAGEELRKSEALKAEATFKLPASGLFLLCLMPIGIMVVEGAFIDWSALFVRDVLSGDAWASGLIYAAFSTVMAITRMSGDWLLDMFGPLPVARISAVSATVGIVMFALAPGVEIAFVAALFSGLGTAIFYPLTMSAAANRPGDSEDNVSAMSLFAFSSFMLAPPILGFIVDVWGLRVALLVIAPLAAGSLLLTGELKKT
ncbi:MAG: MFS transporter [Rhizobiaceae bacterium]